MNIETAKFEIEGCTIGIDITWGPRSKELVTIYWISYNHVTSIWEVE